MKVILRFLASLVLITASSAFSGSDPDEIGIYFDEAGTTPVITADGTADVYIDIGEDTGPVGLYFGSNSFYSTNGVISSLDPDRIPLYPSTGSSDLPVAMINGEAPVASESRSWDGVKVLFR